MAGKMTDVEEATKLNGREAFQARVKHDIGELTEVLPGLEKDFRKAGEELAKAEVIRRHVARNPEKFSPHERENIFQRVQSLAVKRQNLETGLEALRERLELLKELQPHLGTQEPAAPKAGGALEIYQAVEAERLRIARDLHDGPAQILANLVLEAEILDRLLRRDPALLSAELQEFKNQVKNAVADMRRFMFDLRPSSLDDLGLIATMRRIATEYQDRTGIVCRFNVTGEEKRLHREVEEAIFWIIQEGLTNVRRHAQARTVEINLDIQKQKAGLRIRDDGAGFDPEDYQQEGGGRRKLGLLGMRERAATVAGTLEIRSQPGSGAEVEAIFDLKV
jgi:two-component system sensor histidine kinase DegS